MKQSLVVLAVAGVMSVGAFTPAQQGSEGQQLYDKYCAACHGQKGVPTRAAQATWPELPSLIEPGFLDARTDDSIAAVTHSGIGRDMPARKDQLTREQLLAIAQYVRSLAPQRAP